MKFEDFELGETYKTVQEMKVQPRGLVIHLHVHLQDEGEIWPNIRAATMSVRQPPEITLLMLMNRQLVFKAKIDQLAYTIDGWEHIRDWLDNAHKSGEISRQDIYRTGKESRGW